MSWVIYGANGYTGSLIAREAVNRGMRPILAGRNRSAVQALATELGLEARIATLDAQGELEQLLRDQLLVLHCAGPFSYTSQPMIDACLATGTHYLDITGEIDVFEKAWRRREEARRADVVLCPGTGFDVVPTDCLAARLVERLPAATGLVLAFEASGGPSPGTAKTSLEALGGGRVRRDGVLRDVPMAWKQREVDFAHGRRRAVTIPWGDVFTAWVSTGVPNIEVYMAMPPKTIRRMKRSRWLAPLLRTRWFRKRLQRRIESSVRGPDEQRRRSTGSEVWGEASSADGRVVRGSLSGPNGYELTVTASLGIVERLLSNSVEGGYYTPSLLMGPMYAESLPGVTMRIED